MFFVALWGLYLLFANVNGSFKIGLRFLILEIHPMKVGGTYMSSFMVNILLVIIQVPAMLEFMAMALSESVAMTDIDTIMNQSIRFTTFFTWFYYYQVFEWLILFWVALTCMYLYMFPNDKDARSGEK